MADAQDSDSCPFSGGVGSSPIFRSVKPLIFQGFYFFVLHFVLHSFDKAYLQQRFVVYNKNIHT